MLGLALGVLTTLLRLIATAFLTTLIFRWITTLALLRWVLGLAYGIGAALLLVVLRFGARIGRIGLAHKTLLMSPANTNRYQRIWLHPATRAADNSR